MRVTLATIVLTGLPAVVLAQSPPAALPPIGLPLPPIGLPLPPIGLPLPSIGLAPPAGTLNGINSGQPSQTTENRQSARRRFRADPTVVYFIPMYGWGYPPPSQAATPGAMVPDTPSIPRRQESRTGRLRLDVQPEGVLQLYVDRYFVGTPGDFDGELELEAGAHEIEIRAPGYETLAFEVKITAGRSITYRGTLKPADAAAAPATAPVTPDSAPAKPAPDTPATPTTFFYIPGCYIGNVPPEDVVLPATCDRSRLITRKPLPQKPQKN